MKDEQQQQELWDGWWEQEEPNGFRVRLLCFDDQRHLA